MIQNEIEPGNGAEVQMDPKGNMIGNIIQLKIVYWGPGESGKTTNFLRLKEKLSHRRVSEGYSIETNDGRTLWQDSMFLSFEAAINRIDYEIITHIVTCTGQERFLTTREYVLNGADGIIFVGDSKPSKLEQNKRSFRELLSFASPRRIPYIIQLNKQDIVNKITVREFKKELGLPDEEQYADGTYVVYPSVALTGQNVIEPFKDLLGQVLFILFNSK
jgi:signal recognition particle receptor subunit beta